MTPRREPRIRIGVVNWMLVLANAAAVIVAFGYGILTWFQLPDPYPIHFGSGGQPDRWVAADSPEWFLVPFFAAVTAVIVVSLAVALPRIPVRFWNIPGKKHLAKVPAIRLTPLARSTVAMLLVLSVLNTALMIWIQAMMFRSATDGTFTFTAEIIVAMTLYTGIIVAWVIRLAVLSARIKKDLASASA